MNYNELNRVIDESGLKKAALAKKLGMKPETLQDRLRGKSEFKLSEVSKISVALGMSRGQMTRIFFANDVK